ncbi:MAG: thiamine-phosphate kinase [Bacteroidales bacterium]|nr:thiamine-phosphate kinase [Bacteroidales bacterium]
MDPIRTEITELGEFALIDHLTKHIQLYHTSTQKGVGDDAAVMQFGNTNTLLSTDLLIEGIHFDLSYTPLKHLGYKAVAMNISDIAAMNGIASHMIIGIAVSNRFSLEALEELYEGILLACKRYRIDLVGGDTTSSNAGLMIAVTMTGTANTEEICYRAGAKTGDLLCVSGDLGSAYMGLLLLEREKAVFQANPHAQPELDGYDYVLERQLKPEPRTDIIEALKENGIKPTSMIDVSDGLASEIMHLCKNSGLGCHVYEEKIPIDATTINLAEEFKIIPSVAALNGGEDYELLFTIDQKDYEAIRKLNNISIIGHMTEAETEALLITPDNQAVNIQAQGWDAFKKRTKH